MGKWLALFAFLHVCTALIPAGFTTFFRGSSCPSGWTETHGSKGRLIVSVSDANIGGLTVGNPLGNMEDRTHTHSIVSSIYLDVKSVSAIGCCNPDGACYGSYPVNGKTASQPSGLPFVQLLLCTNVNNTAGDIPYGTFGYFANGTVNRCEDINGWATFSTAAGRSLIPGYTTGLFSSVTAPLSSQENRAHTHSFSTSFKTEDQSYAGVTGCCDKKLADDKTYHISDLTQPSSSNLPYLQLLTCVCQVPTFNINLPSNAYLFTEISCPPGYRISEVLAGRFLVSLPENGTPGAVFGGPSFPQETMIGNNHSHPFNTYFNTNECEIGLASGCCGSGYVKNQQYISEGITDVNDIHFPFLAVPVCEPDVNVNFV